MRELVVEGAKVRCSHGMGFARPRASREFLRILGRGVLVDIDMVGNSIRLCPNVGPTTKPCTTTLLLTNGRSNFVFANGAAVVLHRARGATNGIPPGVTYYSVKAPNQPFVFATG